MRWTIHLDGGPRRVNHAAVAIGHRIFSFGGYSSEERFGRNELIDVHVLDTRTYRWRKVSPPSLQRLSRESIVERTPQTTQLTFPTAVTAPIESPPVPAITVDEPSESDEPAERAIFRQAAQPRRSIPYLFALAAPMAKDAHGRRRTIAELHPLGQLRSYRPPLEAADASSTAAGTSPRSLDSGFSEYSDQQEYGNRNLVETEVEEEEHEHSLIHAFRRQRAATVDIASAQRASDSEEELVGIGVDFRQQLNAFAADIRQIQATHQQRSTNENAPNVDVEEIAQVVDQMAQDFDELGPMDVNDYYYGEAPGAPPMVIGDDERLLNEEDEDDESMHSDYNDDDDFEDFGEGEDEDNYEDGEIEIEEVEEPPLVDAPVVWQNYIDGNDNDEVYDDFDFNYHNVGVVGYGNGNGPINADMAAVAVQLLHDRRRSHQNGGRLAPQAGGEPPRRRAHSLFAAHPLPAMARRKSRQYVAPFHRYGHTVVEYRGKAYLWGGRNDEQTASAVLHMFDPSTLRWSVIRPAAGSFEPPARDGHSAVVYGDSMYIFGGFEERYHRFSQETYAFHFPTATWKRLNTEGELPLHRDFHTACVLADGRMYVFGGRSDESGQFISDHDVYCDKLWALDFQTLRWMEVDTTGEAPCGRRSHSIWIHNGLMYLFGGFSGENDIHYNDLYVFDPIRAHWRVVRPSGGVTAPPSPRRRQCTVVVGDRVFLFGGTMPGDNKKQLRDLADLYVLDYAPSLLTLSAEAMLRYKMTNCFDDILPYDLLNEIQNMSRPNSISQMCDSNSNLLSD